MATFKKHKEASNKFHEDIADRSYEAVQSIGETLKKVGGEMAGDETKQKPGSIFADAIIGIAKAHAKFREGALDAASKALKTVREDD
jgi:hypothetical protein